MKSPRLSVVIPVFNRTHALQRALASLVAQTFADFECIVVDDCSTEAIEPIVSAVGDPRFLYLRNAKNGGPYNARTAGYRQFRGEFLFQLDSDWEAFPWALSQSVHYLDAYPQVDAVAGMHLRERDSAMFVRVGGVRKIVTPADYLKGRRAPDCVGAVRRPIVQEWLAKRSDYFAMEFHQWFTFSLQHSQLYVDEPWTRYHVDGRDRVSIGHLDRRLDDYMKFIEEHDHLLRTIDAPFLSELLFNMWFELLRAGRTAQRKRIHEYLTLRKVPVAWNIASRLVRKISAVARKDSGRADAPFII